MVLLRTICWLSVEKNSTTNPLILNDKTKREIRKLTTGPDEDYTTGCLLNYEYIKNHYIVPALDLSG